MKDKISSIDERIAKLKERKRLEEKRLRYNAKQNDRKARARRLIETGALAEKYFDIEHLTIDEREAIFKMFSSFVKSQMPSKFKKNN